jgi:hypothetical protein
MEFGALRELQERGRFIWERSPGPGASGEGPQHPRVEPVAAPHADSRVDDGVRTVDASPTYEDRRTFGQGIVSFAGAVGIALIAPLAILLIGLPIAVGVRGIVEAVNWILAFVSG